MNKNISQIGKEMLLYQELLAKKYKYKPVPIDLFHGDVRDKYLAALPKWCQLEGSDEDLYTLSGTKIAAGYRRVVIGDYGAFIEFSKEQAVEEKLHCKKGQEYRYLDTRFIGHVKYLWLTAKDDSDTKIYLQKKTVDYADYRPGFYYVSPYEVQTKERHQPISTTQALLQRFVSAQQNTYSRALEEIKEGCKKSHWMWYIFPQLTGLGHSSTARVYGIANLEEAVSYLQNPILKDRLIEISEALLDLPTNDAGDIFGYPDNLKLRSCMTLFVAAGPDYAVFQNVLDKFFNGKPDELTLKMLGEQSSLLI